MSHLFTAISQITTDLWIFFPYYTSILILISSLVLHKRIRILIIPVAQYIRKTYFQYHNKWYYFSRILAYSQSNNVLRSYESTENEPRLNGRRQRLKFTYHPIYYFGISPVWNILENLSFDRKAIVWKINLDRFAYYQVHTHSPSFEQK